MEDPSQSRREIAGALERCGEEPRAERGVAADRRSEHEQTRSEIESQHGEEGSESPYRRSEARAPAPIDGAICPGSRMVVTSSTSGTAAAAS